MRVEVVWGEIMSVGVVWSEVVCGEGVEVVCGVRYLAEFLLLLPIVDPY